MINGLFAAKDGLVKLPILYGPARGIRMRFNLDPKKQTGTGESSLALGKYDKPILKNLAELIQPGMTVWDCGVFIGYYTCFFARAVGASGRVIAFEPDPQCLGRAQANVTLNGFKNVTFVPMAIGGENGRTPFIFSGNTNSHIPGGWIGSSREQYEKNMAVTLTTSEVQVTTLDDAVSLPGVAAPDVVKVDIEGIEGIAIPKTRALISQHRPIFVVELHNPECDRIVWTYFDSAKYRIFDATNLRRIASVAESSGTLLCMPERSKL